MRSKAPIFPIPCFQTLLLRRTLVHFILLAFLVNIFGPIPVVQAQDFKLPAPGVMVHLSPQIDPPMLKGIKVHPDNPFRFNFILDKGDSELSKNQLKDESSKLIKYFLASLTIPDKDLWVNLSPYEKDRIIPNSFGLTEMGRDLLAEDYILKQITASLIYPEDEVGKKFWKRIYEEAAKRYGTTDISVNTFNKVWIVPEKAVVYENAKAGTAYVVESKLKVMLEQDYLSLEKHEGIQIKQTHVKETNQLGNQIVREIIIPELAKEVNEGKNFAQLRQVYNSLILATWYKKKIKDSILSQVYLNKKKVAGVNIDDPQEKGRIYQQYLKAFKKGVYNYIKEDIDPTTQETIPRKYFSGGFDLTDLELDAAMVTTTVEPVAKGNLEEVLAGFVIATDRKMKGDGLTADAQKVLDKKWQEALAGIQAEAYEEDWTYFKDLEQQGRFTGLEMNRIKQASILISQMENRNFFAYWRALRELLESDVFKKEGFNLDQRLDILEAVVGICQNDKHFYHMPIFKELEEFLESKKIKEKLLSESQFKDIMQIFVGISQTVTGEHGFDGTKEKISTSVNDLKWFVEDRILNPGTFSEVECRDILKAVVDISQTSDLDDILLYFDKILSILSEQKGLFNKDELKDVFRAVVGIAKTRGTNFHQVYFGFGVLLKSKAFSTNIFNDADRRDILQALATLCENGQIAFLSQFQSLIESDVFKSGTFNDVERSDILKILVGISQRTNGGKWELYVPKILQRLQFLIESEAFKTGVFSQTERRQILQSVARIVSSQLAAYELIQVLGALQTLLLSEVDLDLQDLINKPQQVNAFVKELKDFDFLIRYYQMPPILFQKLWDINEKYSDERDRVVRKRLLLNALVRNMHNESLRQAYFDSKLPFTWLYQIKDAFDKEKLGQENFMVAVHLAAMAGMFLKENGEFSIQKMVIAYANQLLDEDKQLPSPKIEGDALKVFKFGDRSFIKLLPKPSDAPKGYRPRFEVNKQFLITDIDDNKKGLGFISESRQLPVLAQLHGGRVKFIKVETSQRTVVYEADDRLFIYSTEEMGESLPQKELMDGFQETLARALSQIYNLWSRGKVHTAVSRLMHADRQGDNRPWVYWTEGALDQMRNGNIETALSGNPRNGGFIRDMTKYMGQDSNIRWRIGLVDAEHIVDTDEQGQFWASLFDMVMNFSYSGVHVNHLNNDHMWEMFSAIKIKDRDGKFLDFFRDRESMESLWNAMRDHIDQISYSDYGDIKKYIELSLPNQMKDMPEAIEWKSQEYEVGIHIIKSEIKPVVRAEELIAAQKVMANPQLVSKMVGDSVKANILLNEGTKRMSNFQPEAGIIVPGTEEFNRYLATRSPLQQKLLKDSLRSGFKGNHADKIIRAFINSSSQAKSRDLAMKALKESKTGGIDLTSANMNLQMRNSGSEIKFYLDPAMLQQLQNAPGFVPVIINIQPMKDIKLFLGISD